MPLSTAPVSAVSLRPTSTRETLRGKLEKIPQRVGIGGEAAPGGYAIKMGRRLVFIRDLDESKLRGLVGKELVVTGPVSMKTWGGVETRGGKYEVVTKPTVRLASEANVTKLKGKVVMMPHLMGIGGEAPPGGPALKIGKRLVFLGSENEARFAGLEGKTVTVSGEVVKRTWGGVETRGGTYELLRNPKVV